MTKSNDASLKELIRKLDEMELHLQKIFDVRVSVRLPVSHSSASLEKPSEVSRPRLFKRMLAMLRNE